MERGKEFGLDLLKKLFLFSSICSQYFIYGEARWCICTGEVCWGSLRVVVIIVHDMVKQLCLKCCNSVGVSHAFCWCRSVACVNVTNGLITIAPFLYAILFICFYCNCNYCNCGKKGNKGSSSNSRMYIFAIIHLCYKIS